MPVALALDLGTTSTAAVAVDQSGRLVRVVRGPHGANVSGLPAGHAEQDPQRHLDTAIELLRGLADDLNDEPVCLGLTGQMHSVLRLDDRRRPIGNLITWQDRRANETIDDRDRTYLEEYLCRCDSNALADTGCRLSPGYAAVTLFVLREQGKLTNEVTSAALLADWVAAELANANVLTDRSNAASTGVFDVRKGQWSDALLAAGELSNRLFSRVAKCGTIVGTLTQQWSERTGLPKGLPIVLPIGDNQASVIGSVPQGEPAIQITIGTGGQINWPLERFLRIEGMDTRPLPPDRLMLVGAGLAGGDAFAWVQQTVHQWLNAFGVSRNADETFATLLELATKVPRGAEGLTCEPYFRGTRADPLQRGAFMGVDTSNFTPGHVARSMLEGIAEGMYGFWNAAGLARLQDVQRIIGCGNGLERNGLLRQIISDRFAMPLLIPGHEEAAAYGAALLAGVSVDLWDNIKVAGAGIAFHDESVAVKPAVDTNAAKS